MSEYQWYEFAAIDAPLSSKQMEQLRALSTRATIAPTSFCNEYNWGDFKGHPLELMKTFFDAHVHVTNCGSGELMVRIPLEALSRERAAALTVQYVLAFVATRTHWIITWSLAESEDYDHFEYGEGQGWMASLVPVRDELLRGDLRSLYIGWLAAVTAELVDDDEREPLAVEGLGQLTGAQQALASFLAVDEDLLAGAAMGNPPRAGERVSPEEVDGWLEQLSRTDVHTLLRQLLDGQSQVAERTLRNRFAAWQRDHSGGSPALPQRTVAELWENATVQRAKRREREKKARERREAARRRKHEKHLAELAADFPAAWDAVQQSVNAGTGRAYDDGCKALQELSEAYALHSTPQAFQRRLKRFMAANERRKALRERLVRAGLWPGRGRT